MTFWKPTRFHRAAQVPGYLDSLISQVTACVMIQTEDRTEWGHSPATSFCHFDQDGMVAAQGAADGDLQTFLAWSDGEGSNLAETDTQVVRFAGTKIPVQPW
jgi:hypothetical protein